MIKLDNLVVVIRQSGERTYPLCAEIIKKQVKDENVHVIHEVPFSQAVLKTFMLGAESSLKWLLAVDGDVLLKDTAVSNLLLNAEMISKKYGDKLFVYQGNVLCKIFGQFRQAGFHLYNNKLSNRALEYCSLVENNVRPESDVYGRMKKEGFYHYIDANVYGLHAYEQDYFSCYRNGYFQSIKHISHLHQLVTHWKRFYSNDHDYRFFLEGLIKGLRDSHSLIPNQSVLIDRLFDGYNEIGIEEKSDTILKTIRVEDVLLLEQEKLKLNPNDLKKKLKVSESSIPFTKRLIKNILIKLSIQLRKLATTVLGSYG